MKSFKLLLSVLALVAFAAAPVLRAQADPSAPPPAGAPEHKGRHGHKGPHGDRLKELAEKLGLTDDQQAKIKPIFQDEMQSWKALREDTSMDKKTKHEKMMEIRKTHAGQIFAILTPEQQAKFKEMRGQHKMREQHKGPKPSAQ